MGAQVATQQTAQQRADARVTSHGLPTAVRHGRPSSVRHLQSAIGNRAMSSLLSSRTIQPKLTISQPGDEYEREADRVADRVMRMSDAHQEPPLAIGRLGVVQRKCACEGTAADCPECTQQGRSK